MHVRISSLVRYRRRYAETVRYVSAPAIAITAPVGSFPRRMNGWDLPLFDTVEPVQHPRGGGDPHPAGFGGRRVAGVGRRQRRRLRRLAGDARSTDGVLHGRHDLSDAQIE